MIPDRGKKMEDEDTDKDKDKEKEKGKGKDKGKDEPDEVSSTPATVVIKAPLDVTVSFNGRITRRNSEEESFKTPRLAPGRAYAYQVRAETTREGKKLTRNKRVLVRAGRTATVDFMDLDVAAAKEEPVPARVTVLLPAGSKLVVDGKEYGTAARQTFTTPKLEPGKAYFYTVKAENLDDGKADTRRVNVEAGKEVTVDFRDRSVAAVNR